MKLSPNTWTIIHWIYDNVHAALWAVLAALIVTIIVGLPRILENRAIAEQRRAAEISNENRYYCEKWGMPAGTDKHASCVLDLQEIRAKEEQRIANDNNF